MTRGSGTNCALERQCIAGDTVSAHKLGCVGGIKSRDLLHQARSILLFWGDELSVFSHSSPDLETR